MLKPALTMVVIATSTVLLTTARADAYQFFNNRDSWNNAVQGKQIVTEDFKNDGFVTEDTVFSSGFRYVDSGFLGGARVSDNNLQVGLGFPGSLEEFGFPNPVTAFGFDFTINKDKFIIEDGKSFGSVTLGSSGNSGFFGVLGLDTEAPISGFRTISPGEIGTNIISNFSFTSKAVAIPENNNIFGLAVFSLCGLCASVVRKTLFTTKAQRTQRKSNYM